MRRIKNDPKRYLKRSDLLPKNKRSNPENLSDRSIRELEFSTAEIDQSGYITFRQPKTHTAKR